MPSNEEVQKALQVIQEYKTSIQRGDSFDIGNEGSTPEAQVVSSPQVINMLSTRNLSRSLNIDERQAENLRSLIIGGGTAGVHKLLRKQIGDEPAAVLGALASAWAVKKFLR